MLGLGLSLTKSSVVGWNPSELGSKLEVWLKFNTGITTTVLEGEDQVTSWADQSGNGNNVAPTADDDKNEMPRLMADGTLKFNSNTDSLVFTSPLSLGKFAVYWKANWHNTISNDVPFEGNTNNFIKIATPTEIRVKADGQTREDATIDEITDDGTTPVILGMERNEDGDFAVYKDNIAGAFSTSSPKDGNTPIANTLDLTQIGDGTATSDWYEVVICSDNLSASERNELYDYLFEI